MVIRTNKNFAFILCILAVQFFCSILETAAQGKVYYHREKGNYERDMGASVLEHFNYGERDHYFFYALTVVRNKGATNITELYNEPTAVSEQVRQDLQKYSAYWVNTSRKPARVIIPVVIYYDSDGRKKNEVLPLRVSKNKNEFRKAIVAMPIVISYYPSER